MLISDRLRFRRQFILSPEKISNFAEWKTVKLPECYYLSVHPDLKLTYLATKEMHIILLGDVINPLLPGATNKEILHQIVKNCKTIQNIIREFYSLAGRYVCLVYLQNSYFCFTDTTGFRSVYYLSKKSRFWLASQPSLLAYYLNIGYDISIVDDLEKLHIFKNSTEYWYPGITSQFLNVLHLLPNHMLNCKENTQSRYWPDRKIEKLTLNNCAEQCALLLKQIMESAAARSGLAIAVTAGLDSRMVLAGSYSLGDSVDYFTHTHPGLKYDGIDITLPASLLKHIGLKHQIILHTESINPDFQKIFEMNVAHGRRSKLINANTMFEHFSSTGKEKVVVHGVPGEVTRNFFYTPPGIILSPELLCELTRMKPSVTAYNQFEKWLQTTASVAFKYDIRTLDLFYWEQRTGNWAATSYNEYDIAFDSFTPFSCRALLTTMLGVESKFRTAPGFILQKEIIRRLKPELLKFPINPPDSLNKTIRRRLKYSPMYKIFKAVTMLKYTSLLSEH